VRRSSRRWPSDAWVRSRRHRFQAAQRIRESSVPLFAEAAQDPRAGAGGSHLESENARRRPFDFPAKFSDRFEVVSDGSAAPRALRIPPYSGRSVRYWIPNSIANSIPNRMLGSLERSNRYLDPNRQRRASTGRLGRAVRSCIGLPIGPGIPPSGRVPKPTVPPSPGRRIGMLGFLFRLDWTSNCGCCRSFRR